jgi:nucleotide sugar dehydrogenase
MRNNIVIGIIGQGFVGSAVREKFKEDFKVYAYDKFNDNLSKIYTPNLVDSISGLPAISDKNIVLCDVIENSDYIFVCVPTPMYEDGECDTRIVESVIQDIHDECNLTEKNITIVCKSTMPPGTTERLNKLSARVKVLFSPEFLTEANSIEDFKNQTRLIIGTPEGYHNNPDIDVVRESFNIAFPKAEIVNMKSSEAEMVKYMTNLFLATKVSFFNDMYSICDKLNINFDKISDVTLLDKRIGTSHYQVPGPDGDRGYGGHCFPKDMQAIIYMANSLGVKIPTLNGAEKTNNIVRSNKDWEKMNGRAVSKRDTNQLELSFNDKKTREKYPANIEGSLEFNQYGQATGNAI